MRAADVIRGCSILGGPILFVGAIVLYISFVWAPQERENGRIEREKFVNSCLARGGTITENYGGWAGTPPYVCEGLKK